MSALTLEAHQQIAAEQPPIMTQLNELSPERELAEWQSALAPQPCQPPVEVTFSPPSEDNIAGAAEGETEASVDRLFKVCVLAPAPAPPFFFFFFSFFSFFSSPASRSFPPS